MCLSSLEGCQVLSEGRGRPSSGEFPIMHHVCFENFVPMWDMMIGLIVLQSCFMFVSGLRCHEHDKRKARDDPPVWCWEWLQGKCSYGNLSSQGTTSSTEQQIWTASPFCAQIFFIESVCDDPSVIASNIMVSRKTWHHSVSRCEKFITLSHQVCYLLTIFPPCAGSEGVVSRLPGLQ